MADGLYVALILSRRLRRLVLRVSLSLLLASPLIGLLSYWLLGHAKAIARTINAGPQSGDLVNLILVATPLLLFLGGLVGVFGSIYFCVAARLVRVAAEDGRDLAQDLGFVSNEKTESSARD